jgi:hypothetical protein
MVCPVKVSLNLEGRSYAIVPKPVVSSCKSAARRGGLLDDLVGAGEESWKNGVSAAAAPFNV